jgi:uncharacterized protein YuzE
VTFDLDTIADAVYVQVEARPVASTRELDPQRLIDYDLVGDVVGIEFLSVHDGVDLRDLPYHDELMQLFGEHQIRVFA